MTSCLTFFSPSLYLCIPSSLFASLLTVPCLLCCSFQVILRLHFVQKLLHFFSSEYLFFCLSACFTNISLKSLSPLFLVPGSCFRCHWIMNALKRPLMHSKCHIATAPVSQNDDPVPVSNILYSVCFGMLCSSLCVSWKTE